MYGVDSNPAASLMGQYSTLGTIAMILVAWFARNVEDNPSFSGHFKKGLIIQNIH